MPICPRLLSVVVSSALPVVVVAGSATAAPVPPPCTVSGTGVVVGTSRDDVVCGRNGSGDRLYAYGGNDVLVGRSGADRMGGGIGNDYYYVDDPGDQVVEQADAGYDTVRLQTADQYTVPALVERLRAWGSAVDVLGNASADRILGGDGNDTIDGRAGSDDIDGEGGDDRIDGDAPDVQAGAGDDEIFGGDGNDVLDGRYGADTVVGGAGEDYIDGSYGDDVLYGGPGADDFYFGLPPDDDTIGDFASGTDKISLYGAANDAPLTYVGSGSLPGDGEAAVQVVVGTGLTKINVDLDGDGQITPATYGDFVISMPAGTTVAQSDLVLVRPPA